MVDKDILDLIESERGKGYDDVQIRNYLLQVGHNSQEINQAFQSVSPPTDNKTKLKEAFKPTLLKLFIPLIILILIIISTFINLKYLPIAGDVSCRSQIYFEDSRIKFDGFNDLIKDYDEKNARIIFDNLHNDGSFEELASENVSISLDLYNQLTDMVKERNDLETNFFLLRDSTFKVMKNLIIFNYYIAKSDVLRINPFFPESCEVVLSENSEAYFYGLTPKINRYCRYYISEKDYNCLNDFEIDTEETTNPIFGRMPPYKPISIPNLALHTVILMVLLYTIVALVTYFSLVVTEYKIKHIKIATYSIVFITGILGFLMNMWFIFYAYFPFVLFLGTYLLIDKQKPKKIFLHVMVILYTVLLIAGLFIINAVLLRSMLASLV